MVLWEPRLQGTAMGWEELLALKPCTGTVFGLHSCESQEGSGRGCAKHTSLGEAVLGVSALHPAQSAPTAFASCSHRAGSQPFYLRDVQTHLPLRISPPQDISLPIQTHVSGVCTGEIRAEQQEHNSEVCLGEEPQKKLAAGKETSPPARLWACSSPRPPSLGDTSL